MAGEINNIFYVKLTDTPQIVGFVKGFKMRKQRSTGELEKKVSGSIRSTASCTSWISTGSSQSAMGESYNTDSNASFIVEVLWDTIPVLVVLWCWGVKPKVVGGWS